MIGEKVKTFITLAGQKLNLQASDSSPEVRKLGAQLLLSEVLEYVIKGLGVIPEIEGHPISKPDGLTYRAAEGSVPNQLEMLDGLADVAYTMYWNALTFGLPLEQAFDLVCDNNLEKFVKLDTYDQTARTLEPAEWSCKKNIVWPPEVVSVEVIQVGAEFYAVGKDARGKVRKPSSYASVNLKPLLKAAYGAFG